VVGVQCLVTASNTYDIFVYDSSSLTAGDHYTETSHSNLLASGALADPPGVITISAAKLNTNAAPWGAMVVQGFKGVVWHTGGVVSYAPLNITLTGASPVGLVLLGESLWTNGSVINASGAPAARVTTLGNLVLNGDDPWLPDGTQGASDGDITAGLDALRVLGHWDLARNLPWAQA